MRVAPLLTVALLAAAAVSGCADDVPTARNALATVCGDAEVESLDEAPYDDFDGETVSDARGDLAFCEVSFDLPTNYYGATYDADPTEDLEGIESSAQKSDGATVAWTVAGSDDTWTVIWVIGPGDADLTRLRMLDDDGFDLRSDDTTY